MAATLPPLQLFRYFDAAARLGSFKAAAVELNVTQGAVSQRIRALEEFVGQPLFDRLTRKVVLTEAGERLSAASDLALRELTQAIREVRVSGTELTVNVEVGPFISSRWLAPRLSKFYELHPKANVVLHHSIGGRLPGRDIDVAILWGEGSWKAQAIRLILPVKLQPICTPLVLDHIKACGGIAGNHGLPLLHVQDRSDWDQWFRQAGLNPELAKHGPIFDEPNVIIEAAVGGQGIALGYLPLSNLDIKSGRLTVADPVSANSTRSYYLVLNTLDTLRTPAVRRFHDWIVSEAEKAR